MCVTRPRGKWEFFWINKRRSIYWLVLYCQATTRNKNIFTHFDTSFRRPSLTTWSYHWPSLWRGLSIFPLSPQLTRLVGHPAIKRATAKFLFCFSFLITAAQISLLGVAFGLLAAYLISSGEKGRIVAGEREYWTVSSNQNFYLDCTIEATHRGWVHDKFNLLFYSWHRVHLIFSSQKYSRLL